MSSIMNHLKKDANGNGIPDLAEKYLGADNDRNGIPDRADRYLGTGAGSGMKGQMIAGALRSQFGSVATGQPGMAGTGMAGSGTTGGVGQMPGAVGGNQAAAGGISAQPNVGAAAGGSSVSQILHDIANRH